MTNPSTRTQSTVTQPARTRVSRRDVARAVVAGLVLVVLCAGLPALLWALGAFPLPTSLPSPDELSAALSQPDSGELLLRALLLAAWVGWATFTGSVLVEAFAQARGRYAPRLPGLAPVQHLAASLVAALAVLAPTVPVGLAAAPGPPGALTVAAAPPASPPEHRDVGVVTHNSAPAPAPAAFATPARQAEKVYVVRRRDTLWSIAARHLGDPLRWPEIADLNYDRPQPDGRRLTDPHWIYPGWQLLMPDDAVDLPTPSPPDGPPAGKGESGRNAPGPGPAPERSGAATPTTAAQPPRTPAGEPPTTGRGAGPEPIPARAPEEAADRTGDPPRHEVPAIVGLTGAGLMAAGTIAALARLRVIQRRRRRPGQRPPRPLAELLHAEAQLRVLAEPDNREFLDLALRTLAHLCAAAGTSTDRPRLPDIIGARLSAHRLELFLAEPATCAPRPFVASADGATWSVPQHARLPLTAEASGDVLAPFPGLVPLGHDEAGLVLLDLEALGSIAITGPREDALAVLRWAAAELAVNGWSDYLHATLVGFGAELRSLDPERLTHAETLTDRLLGHVQAMLLPPARRTGEDVLDSRLRETGEGCSPEFLLLAEPPTGAQAERLRRLLGDEGRSGLAVLAVGDWPAARTTLHVQPEGTIAIPPLGLTVHANRLAPDATRTVADLLTSARADPRDHDPTPQDAASADTETPRHPASTAQQAGPSPGISAPPQPTHSPARDELDAAVTAYLDESDATVARVGIIGPPQLRASGPVDSNRVTVSTELIAYLATHGRRVDKPAELDLALWPDRAVRLSTRSEAVARARKWLGDDADGTPHLPHGYGGELRLGPGVLLDWDLLRRLAARGLATGADGRDDLATALRLVRGKPFEGVPPGRYRWLAETFLEQDIPAAVVDAAHGLARLCLDAGDPAGAREAARIAQLVDRYDERPWRDLLEAEHALGSASHVRALVDDLKWLLEVEVDDELTEETRELLERILPRRPHRSPRPRSA
jgi:hypothetical protein